MTQDSKEILLKVLSEQLPYGVLILDTAAKKYGKLYQINNSDSVWYDCQETGDVEYQTIFNVKPYLRPMSSMTEDEKKVYHKLLQMSVTVIEPNSVRKIPMYTVDLEDDGDGLNHLYDWFNENHFDYRGLIPMGLALEAPEDMYKTK